MGQHHNIRVGRGSQGFGLSLIYKGLDKYPQDQTGTFVQRIVPGGSSYQAGLRVNDKILKINNKVPRDVNDAVNFIKKAGKSMVLSIERNEMNSDHLMEGGGGQLSRSNSVKSFNTQFASSRPQTPFSSSGEDEEE